MTVLLTLGGLVVAILFGLAGFRICNTTRRIRACKRIPYQGRVQAIYDSAGRPTLLSVTSLVKWAAVAKSTPFRSNA